MCLNRNVKTTHPSVTPTQTSLIYSWKPRNVSMKRHSFCLDFASTKQNCIIEMLVERNWKFVVEGKCLLQFPLLCFLLSQSVTSQNEQDSSEKKPETDKLPALIKVCVTYWFDGLINSFFFLRIFVLKRLLKT